MTQTTYLTGREVMALLNVDRNALYEMRKSGALSFVKVTPRRFRYPADEVRALLGQVTPATEPTDDTGRIRRGRKRAA